ncbi:hypothetical protein BC940DRAFT_153536 [Gongronella butleri]|nr:hypothetical protein BC940DRAFT_153536 [Gongronella butleri]
MTKLAEYTDDFDYKSVRFYSKIDRKPVKRFSNRVAHAAFCPDFDRELEIDHMDLDPSNSAIDNLQALFSYDNLVKPRVLDAPQCTIVDRKAYEPPLDPLTRTRTLSSVLASSAKMISATLTCQFPAINGTLRPSDSSGARLKPASSERDALGCHFLIVPLWSIL